MTLGYKEVKELLKKEYADYFEILDLKDTAFRLQALPQEKWKEELLKKLKHYMWCDELIANNTAYAWHDFYKKEHERKLKVYNKILEMESE